MICNGYLLGEDDDMSNGCKLTTTTNVDLHFHVFSISIC